MDVKRKKPVTLARATHVTTTRRRINLLHVPAGGGYRILKKKTDD